MQREFASFLALLLAILLLLLAIELVFLPMPSIQEDEADFVTPFLAGHIAPYSWKLGNSQIPVMLLDYLGALKSWIYWPIFKLWSPSVWSVRLPVCLLSLVTVWIFADFLRRTTNNAVALLTALLLATDAPFILTNVFDWGPVCLLVLAMALFLQLFSVFLTREHRIWLGAAFLVAGIGTWGKALFVVLLSAVILACFMVFWKRALKWVQPRNIAVAALSFATGAAPLIAFNLEHDGATLTASRYLPVVGTKEKLMMLQRTLDGRALEHYMFRSVPGERITLTGGGHAC